MTVRNRQNLDLNRSQPSWESTSIVLNKNTDKALNGTIYYTVNHNWTMLLAILTDISQIKLLWQLHIQLNGTALPGTTNRILQMEVDFWTIERTITLVDNIVQSTMIQGILQAIGSQLPHFIGTHGVLRTGGQLSMISQAKGTVYLIKEVNNLLNFPFDLLRSHKDMSIILSEVTDPEQAVKGTGQLMTVHKAQFAGTKWQVTIGLRFLVL